MEREAIQEHLITDALFSLIADIPGQNGRGSNPALDSLVAVRNSRPGQPEPCEGNLVAAAG